MTLEEFKVLDARCRSADPGLFTKLLPDRPATEEELRAVERSLGIVLCESYKQFLKHFGGGHYGCSDIGSADPKSEYYLAKINERKFRNMAENFLVISDDGTGGYYGMVIEDGVAKEAICYNDTDDGSVSRTPFQDIFEFIIQDAYGHLFRHGGLR